MNLPDPALESWTLADLVSELARRKVTLTRISCGQNKNSKHFPDKLDWWYCSIHPEGLVGNGPSWRYGHAWSPSLPLAIAKALRNYDEWTPPTFGEKPLALSGADLLKELGL